MAAVARHHQVVVLPRRERSDYARFGAISQMGMSANHSGVFDKRSLDPLLELANANHLGVHPG
jgi:hypothetical protein